MKTVNNIMCKHVLNAQVIIQAECCKKWFDCSECHDEISDHQFIFDSTIKMMCKQCKVCFNKDLKLLTIQDDYCVSCENKWNIPGITPESKVYTETLSNIDLCIESLLQKAGTKL